VAAIDALANYFKHRDEWPNRWNELAGGQKDTATVLRDLGLLGNEGGAIVRHGDFRHGFKMLLGHDQYDRLCDLKGILDSWAKDLRKEYEKELATLRLL
jgi:hypothetical protein